MKKYYPFICFSLLLSYFGGINAQQVNSSGNKGGKGGAGYKMNWTVNPFDHQVFIENKGQFTADLTAGDKILYGAQSGGVYVFITNRGGIIYKYTEHPELHPSADKKHYKLTDPDELDLSLKSKLHYLTANWEGSNDGVSTLASEQHVGYYTYPSGKNKTIVANGFKKITCLNVYPGIDVEFTFPKDKAGVEYSLVVHPGADLAAVKLKYSGAQNMVLDNDGNINIKTDWGEFTDHAPVSNYRETNNPTASGYMLNNGEESFNVPNLDGSQTLVIDPWTTNWTVSPPFGTSGYDGAYDLDFDYAGNVYVYGGYDPFVLVKYNNAGVQQWTFSTTNFPNLYYGDFCVDKASGISFCLEGFGGGTNALTDKISSSGAIIDTFPPPSSTSSLDEQWRASYDLCDHIVLIAGGGTTATYQAATLDTNFTTYTLANVLGLPSGSPYHDMALIATDPLLAIGYMATTTTYANTSLDDNYILQMPLPGMLPINYNVPGNYLFQECSSVAYAGYGAGNTNGMNGMAVSPNWLYMYDGDTLEQHNKNTGALVSSVRVGTTSYNWGGLDVDLCDDIYVGNQTNVDIYNSSLAQTGTIGPFTGNIYDVVLGNGVLSSQDSTLYVCGSGFLSSIKLANPNSPVMLKTRTVFCSCNCSAKGTATFCGIPDTTGVSYLWSTGQTTQTATGLCPGNTYTLTITLGCADQIQDTFNIPYSGTLAVAKSQTPYSCSSTASASVTLSGGSSPYTYSWSNGATTSSIAGLIPGNYCATVTDHTGCQDSVCFIITGDSLPNIVVTPTPDTVCPGSGVALTVSGGVSYVWSPASGLSCISCANPTASPNSTTTYTVTGTDASGCSNTANAIVVVNPPPVITITSPGDSVCVGDSVYLTASGALTYTWTPSTGLSCTNCPNPIANPSSTTIYTVKGTDAEGCTASTSVTVFIALPPTITVYASKTSICQGTSVTMQASASNITSPYTWQPGSMSGVSVSVTPTVTTTYTVTASSACGVATASIIISVNSIPVTAFSADIKQGCAPMCIQFRDRSTTATGAITTWDWSFGNGDTINTKNPIYCFSKAGVYNVSLTTTTDSGCSSTLEQSDMISVYSNPVANFTASPQPTTILQPTIDFTDKSTDAYGIVYRVWNFGSGGDSGTSTLTNPIHTFYDTGTYCVKLNITNLHGCIDTMTDCIVIDPIYTLYIPDAFSPNGDGVNEMFLAKGSDVKDFEMYIFDRWGLQLYHTTDITDGWQGRINNAGSICQQDAYVYVITVHDTKDQKHTYMGTVNLIK